MQFQGFASGSKGHYGGLSNTINVWYEKPFQYSFGFAASPLLATLPVTKGEPPPECGDRVRLVHLGSEGKIFPFAGLVHVFARAGVYSSTLTSNGPLGSTTGTSGLLGIGYEWDLGGIGLAPEFSWRTGWLARSIKFEGSAPAIGLHFYKAL
jgi:hypothetical protein